MIPGLAFVFSALATTATFYAPSLEALNGSAYAEQAWTAVRPWVESTNVHSVVVDPQNLANVAVAAAIADSVLREGKQVSLSRPYSALVDKDFAPSGHASLEVFVGLPPDNRVRLPGYHLVGYVNGHVSLVVHTAAVLNGVSVPLVTRSFAEL